MSRRSSKVSSHDQEDLIYDCKAAYIAVVGDVNTDLRTKHELMEALEMSGRNPTQRALKSYWPSDRRALSFDDFVDICRKERAPTNDELIKAFKKIDINGDGFITVDELHKIMTQKGEKMSKEEVQEIIDDIDENGDGKLDYEEYCNMVNKTVQECKKVSRKLMEKKERKRKSEFSDSRRGDGPLAGSMGSQQSIISNSSQRRERQQSGRPTSAQRLMGRRDSAEGTIDGTDRISGSRRSLLSIDDLPKPSPRNKKDGVISHGPPSRLSPLAEPKNKREWTHTSIKGAFFIDEESIVCHQYELDLTEETQVFITIQPTLTKSMIIGGEGRPIDTALLIHSDRNNTMEVTEKRDAKGKFGIKTTLRPGKYNLVPFTTGCHLKPRTGSKSKEKPLVKKDKEGKTTITKAFRQALEEIFDMCDLDGNGLMSKDEFSWFNWRTSGEIVTEEEWKVVEDNVELEDGELTKNGFIKLNELEAEDGDGDTEDLWVTLDSMGYNKELFIDETCPFKLDVYTEDCDDADLTVTKIEPVDKKIIIRSIMEKGEKTKVKSMKDLEMYTYSNASRASFVIENTSHSKVKVEVDCSNSRNCISSRDTLSERITVLANSQEIGHHLVPADESLDWTVRTSEIIHK